MADNGIGSIGRHPVGVDDRIQWQDVEVDGVQGDVADRYDEHAQRQRPWDGLPGIGSLLRAIGHHVPPAEGEEAGDQGDEEVLKGGAPQEAGGSAGGIQTGDGIGGGLSCREGGKIRLGQHRG